MSGADHGPLGYSDSLFITSDFILMVSSLISLVHFKYDYTDLRE